MIRLVHFSDIHLTSSLSDWAWRDWFCKRGTSWLNHRLFGRARRFALADDIVARLMDDVRARPIDQLIFSGDATALGFESEIGRAAELLRVGDLSIPGLAVPGNHDYCTRFAEASGAFERHFAAWQEGRRIGEHRYPFARQVGPIWLIGVNAATGNRWPWDAGGQVGAAQLERLAQLLAGLPGAVKILVVHYPVCLASGRREPRHHGLRDLDALVQIARAGGVSLWLHGHRHTPYHLPQAGAAKFPVICAGTATQQGIWSHGEYLIEGNALRAMRRVYDLESRCFRTAEEFSLTLK
ncbi:MAG: metallophosphoesterase [Planctomycetes bacterium]|nr:metallophosphoesterase [Planctomycetota bacterium]